RGRVRGDRVWAGTRGPRNDGPELRSGSRSVDLRGGISDRRGSGAAGRAGWLGGIGGGGGSGAGERNPSLTWRPLGADRRRRGRAGPTLAGPEESVRRAGTDQP